MPAGGLAIVNSIVTRAGPALVVKSVTWNRRLEGCSVYNFEVDDYHTYFVGSANGGTWVHNARGYSNRWGGPDTVAQSQAIARELIKRGWKIEHLGGMPGGEEYIKTIDRKGGNYVDITVSKNDAYCASILWMLKQMGLHPQAESCTMQAESGEPFVRMIHAVTYG